DRESAADRGHGDHPVATDLRTFFPRAVGGRGRAQRRAIVGREPAGHAGEQPERDDGPLESFRRRQSSQAGRHLLLLPRFQRIHEGFAEALPFPARESTRGHGAGQGIRLRGTSAAELLRHHPRCYRGRRAHQVGARSEFVQRTLPRRPQTCEGLAMNIYLDVQSPAVKEAGTLASAYGLANHGLVNLRRAYWNLPTPALYEESIFRSEGSLSHLGHPAPPPRPSEWDAHETATEERVGGGQYTRPCTGENFGALLARLQGY